MFYKRLLLRRHAQHMSDTARASLTQDCLRLLSNLQEIDPSRRHRYTDLGKPFRFFGFEYNKTYSQHRTAAEVKKII